MVNVYDDIAAYEACIRPRTKVKSNLCTMYYPAKGRFCGNYCSRKSDKYSKRCWRHKKESTAPKLILLMITSEERVFNRDLWMKFLTLCERDNVPIEFVVYHETMLNCTVRNPNNLISRYRPFPDIFGENNVISLKGQHGTLEFAKVHMQMLTYGANIPQANKCLVITERTIPIRSPRNIYETAMAATGCHMDISFNVHFAKPPAGLPLGPRGMPFTAANNLAQGLFTVKFLNKSLPTVNRHCGRFGIARKSDGTYTVAHSSIYKQWKRFTGSNPCEFWLINSYLLELHVNGSGVRPIRELLRDTDKNGGDAEMYTVAEIPEWRNRRKRTFVFRTRPSEREDVPVYSPLVARYYRGLDFKHLSLLDVVHFLKRFKRRALFFRSVELN